MTIHKTILALLVVALAAIGTTTAVVHADEPETPPETTADPTPESLLNAQDAQIYRGLPSDIKAILANEFLPLLEAKGFDQQSKAEFLILVVQAEHATHNDPIQLTNRMASSSVLQSAVLNVLPGGRCDLTGPVIHHNQMTVSTYSSVSCTVEQRSLISSSQLARTGYQVVGSYNRRIYARTAWSTVVEPYAAGSWRACGRFQSTPKDGYGFAQPTIGANCITGYAVP